jgi:hypothetical protein
VAVDTLQQAAVVVTHQQVVVALVTTTFQVLEFLVTVDTMELLL